MRLLALVFCGALIHGPICYADTAVDLELQPADQLASSSYVWPEGWPFGLLEKPDMEGAYQRLISTPWLQTELAPVFVQPTLTIPPELFLGINLEVLAGPEPDLHLTKFAGEIGATGPAAIDPIGSSLASATRIGVDPLTIQVPEPSGLLIFSLALSGGMLVATKRPHWRKLKWPHV